jgi:hypothetical protein
MAKSEKQIERDLAKEEVSVKAMLAKEKKVPIFIPEDPLNPDDVVPVGINGVVYAIPRGQQFEVPESIYKVWKYSYDKTVEANKRIKVEKNKEIQVFS